MLHKIKFLALMLVVATTSVFAQEDSEKDDDFDLVHKKNCPHPYVVSVLPEAGSRLDLSQDTVYFRVTFSEDMGEARGIQWHGKKVDYYWNLDAKDVPLKDLEHNLSWENPRTLLIKFPSVGVKKAKISSFTLIQEGFTNQANSCWMAEDYTVKYKVKY